MILGHLGNGVYDSSSPVRNSHYDSWELQRIDSLGSLGGSEDFSMDQSSNSSDESENSVSSSSEDSYDHYQPHGLTTQEVDRCNRMVSPSQRLKRKSSLLSEDGEGMYSGGTGPISIPNRSAGLCVPDAGNATRGASSLSAASALDRYVAHHSFYQYRAVIFTSQRRAFERDVYDFARSLQLSSKEARIQVARARALYGKEMASDAEDSTWEGEVDDRAPVRGTADESISTQLKATQNLNQEALKKPCKGKEAMSSNHKSEAYADFEPDPTTHEDIPFGRRWQAQSTVTSEAQPAGPRSSCKVDQSGSVGRAGEAPLPDSKRREQRRARRTGNEPAIGASVEHGQTEAESNSDDPKSALEPKNQKEAHENYLRSNAKDSGSVLREDQTEEEQQKLQERMSDFDAYIRGTRDFATKKQVDQYEHGGMRGSSKKMKEEVRAKKDEYDARRSMLQQADKMDSQEVGTHESKRRKKGKERRIHEGFSPSDEAVSVTAAAEDVSTAVDLDQHQGSRPMPEDDARSVSTPPTTKIPRKGKRPTSSPYFPPSAQGGKGASRKNISCIPFPPLASRRFGLMQERLVDDAFRLLIAVIFLNKTRGAVAMPVFYALMERYPSIEALAEAKHDDVLQHIQHLGLQNQRAKKIVGVARAWMACPPEKGKRYRCLHYPRKGDGSDVRPGEVLEDESEDPRVAWEVAHLPGLGAYAFDSWRIFCRDRLRGIDASLDGETTIGEVGADPVEGQLRPEWTRVVPTDKELRAYLRWRWLKAGWAWDPLTGHRERATEQQLKEADNGGVMIEEQERATDIVKE